MDALKRRTERETGAHPRRAVEIPRIWLTALVVLFVAPWLVVAALYTGVFNGTAPPELPLAAPEAPAPGPWGVLSATPIVISPPLEYVSTEDARPGRTPWFFPGVTLDQLESLLTSAGLDAQTATSLRATARQDKAANGVAVLPDPATVRALPADVRARLYLLLASVPLNGDQAHSYRFFGASPEAWLGQSLISPDTRALVEPLIYRDGDFLHFADLDLIRAAVTDEEEIRRLIKALSRQATMLVELTVPSGADVAGLTEYWGRGGRKTDLKPLLESVASSASHPAIDIAHLLPEFAQNLLYRYPKITAADLDRPVIANCLWTALNFFEAEPDDRFLNVAHALNTLKTDYYLVEAGFQLGDIVAFVDSRELIFHAAVYLADDLVLTKNGLSPMAPWVILPLEQVKGYYRTRASDPELLYHRHKGL